MGGPGPRPKTRLVPTKAPLEYAPGDSTTLPREVPSAARRCESPLTFRLRIGPQQAVEVGTEVAIVPTKDGLTVVASNRDLGSPPSRMAPRIWRCIALGYDFVGSVTAAERGVVEVALAGRLRGGVGT